MIFSVTIFLLISLKIGIWRLDAPKYAHYITYFGDVSGLGEKSQVVIAGVKVGWVSKLTLDSKFKQVRLDLMINRDSIIYSNGHAIIRQDGLLGNKYVEIIPGDQIFPILLPGSSLTQPNKPIVAIDELLSTFKEIADNVNKLSSSLCDIVSSDKNSKNISTLIKDAQDAFKQFEKVSRTGNSLLNENNQNIHDLISKLNDTFEKLKDRLPNTIEKLGTSSTEISKSVQKIGKDANEISSSFSKIESSFSNTARPIKTIMDKINSGQGVLGTLLTDENLSKDVRSTLETMKEYFSYVNRLSIDVDTYVESMQGRGNDLDFKDSKGYFNFKIRPADDFYYLIGLSSSYAGIVKRQRTDRLWFDSQKHEIVPDSSDLDSWATLKFAPVKEKYVREYNAITINAQLAKEIGRLSCRLGLFESSFGIGLDYDIPLENDLRWISSFELFRFNEFMTQTLSGRIIRDIDMPHLKWYNKIFFNDSIYFVFGADDFISKFNKNFFVGFGLSFEQDDIKYLASKLSMK